MDDMVEQLVKRWAFMGQVVVVLLLIWWGFEAMYEYPSYIIRWRQVDEPKESNYFGWRVFGMTMGIYAWLLFFGDMVFYDHIDRWWPTLFSLYLDDSGFGEPIHGLSIMCDVLLFAAIAWFSSQHAKKLGFLEANPETGIAVFYPYIGQ